MRKFFICLYLTCFISPLVGVGQVTLCGSVRSASDNQRIAYANIGVLESPIGTISNADGSFCLNIPAEYQGEELIFSSVGYAQQTLRIDANSPPSKLNIALTEKPLALNEVYVYGKEMKKKATNMGNGRSLLLSGQLIADTVTAGSAMSLLIDNTDFTELTFIRNVSLYVAKNKFPEFKIRLRFLALDSSNANAPGIDLVDEQIIAVSDMKQGWLNFEIPHLLEVRSSKFYLMFEWILDKTDRKFIADQYEEYFRLYPERVSYDTVMVDGEKIITPRTNKVLAGTIFGTTNTEKDLENNQCFYRNNSFGEWQRSSDILSAKIEMANYPNKPKRKNDHTSTD